MAWSFAWKNSQKSIKLTNQIKQEAAQVLAMGGGFQTYWQQNRDGTPQPYQFDKMAEIVRFCNERKPFCFQSKVIPQIGLLYSTYSWKRKPASHLYSAHSQGALKGNLNLLLDSQLPVEILMDHQLSERIKEYPLLVLPEWDNIDPLQKEDIISYTKNGGNLIIIGARATDDFSELLGIRKVGVLQKDTLFYAGIMNQFLSLKSDFQPVLPLEGTTTLGSQFINDDIRFKAENPLVTIRTLGKGKIAGIYLELGEFYARNKNTFMPTLIKSVLKNMDIRLVSTVSGSPNVHQVLTRKNNKTYIHLINTSGPHDNPNVMAYEEVNPLSDVLVAFRSAKAPKTVKLQPENKSVNYTYENGNVIVFVPPVKIYSILEINK